MGFLTYVKITSMWPYVHSNTIDNSQDMEKNLNFHDRWMDKEDVVHILLSHKRERNNAMCSNMDATRDYHTKWNKSERKKENKIKKIK